MHLVESLSEVPQAAGYLEIQEQSMQQSALIQNVQQQTNAISNQLQMIAAMNEEVMRMRRLQEEQMPTTRKRKYDRI